MSGKLSLKWRRFCRSRLVRWGGALFVIAFLGLTLTLVWVSRDLPQGDQILNHRSARTTKMLARDSRLIATLYEQNRSPVSLVQVATPMVEAIVAIEDSRFYQHDGVDYRSVARAALANLSAGGLRQGASTITMQLARNMFLSSEKTFRRKLREAVLAQRLESLLDKDEILERYLNQVYFGSGAYGIDAAASTYFAKNPSELTYPEAALLAGLVQAPAHLNPYHHPERARRRQLEVLQRMRQLGYLNGQEWRKAVNEAHSLTFGEPPKTAEGQGLLKTPYFTTYAIHEASRHLSTKELYRHGLEIVTTLDFDLQRQAEAVVSNAIATAGQSSNAHNAALVLIENETGAIRAMVGGTGWTVENQFNRAWQAARQPGSSFKPFVFAQALETGYTPSSLMKDEPVEYVGDDTRPWSPRNYDNRYLGVMTLTEALRLSRNVVAVRLLHRIGPHRVVDLAQRMGLKGDLPPYLSLALGSGEATPLEMAGAYATFPRGGTTVQPFAVSSIRYPSGRTETLREDSSASRVLSEQTARSMVAMLERVVQSGTGTAAALGGRPVAGKTGTTDGYRDAWFVGFTPRYTLAVWVGNDDHSPTWNVSGGALPARIFSRVMSLAEANQPVLAFEPPARNHEDRLFTGTRTYQSPQQSDITVYNYGDPGVTVITNRTTHPTYEEEMEVENAPTYHLTGDHHYNVRRDENGWLYYEFR